MSQIKKDAFDGYRYIEQPPLSGALSARFEQVPVQPLSPVHRQPIHKDNSYCPVSFISVPLKWDTNGFKTKHASFQDHFRYLSTILSVRPTVFPIRYAEITVPNPTPTTFCTSISPDKIVNNTKDISKRIRK